MELPSIDQLHNSVDDLDRIVNTEVDERIQCSSILMCGMGGSAISSNIVLDCCSDKVDIPIFVNRSVLIPKWVGKDTLAVVCSYSGNTYETVEMYERLKGTGCTVAIITSGGRLLEIAKEEGYPYYVIPAEMQPRFSMGYMIGYSALILEAAGYPYLKEKLKEVMPDIYRYRTELEAPGSEAYRLTDVLMDRIPITYMESRFKSVGLRWKAQFNENSKILAFNTPLSALADIKGSVAESYRDPRFVHLILHGIGDDIDRPDNPVGIAADNLRRNNIGFESVDLGGGDHVEEIIRAIMLGDYISLFISDRRHVDPTEVHIIKNLKARIKENLKKLS